MEKPGNHDAELEAKNRNNSHTLMAELVGSGKKVLDIGASTGQVAEALSDKGCVVTGIELDAEAGREAEKYCERVVVGDVESLELSEEFGGESFDVILFGDVLEHLREPGLALKRLGSLLRTEGYVVASIPNVAHGSVRLALLQGKFQYGDLGLLDDTHLRFFTRESVEQLFGDSGFFMWDLERTRRGIFDTEVEVDRESIADETLKLLESDPEARTYQFVLTAYPTGDGAAVSKLANRARTLSEQLSHQDERIQALEEEVGGIGELRRRLEARDDLLADRDRIIYDLRREVRHLRKLQRQLGEANRQLEAQRQEASRLTQEVADRDHLLANRERAIARLESQLGRLRVGER